jgi:hypothetical protein
MVNRVRDLTNTTKEGRGMVKKKLVFCSALVLCLLFVPASFDAQETKSSAVTVQADINDVLVLIIDGTDVGENLYSGDYTTNETCNLGTVDALGTPITGGGADPAVNNVKGDPVDALGNELTSPYDPRCIGSFYQFFKVDGKGDPTQHSTSAISIYARGTNVLTYSLSVQANKVPVTGNVTVDQLKWKEDGPVTPTAGYSNYTAFDTTQHSIRTGGPGTLEFHLFHDYGLLVEFTDSAGPNIWNITYTLATF